jgi:serine/threonine-protein kinase
VATDLLSDLQTTLGSGYRVTRELAGGGMSRVFVAVDAHLDREVVVKLLPPDLMAGLSAERFRAEIQHAVKLQHPNIVPVLSAGVIEYGSGTQGPYYVMPFIRGETLRARLERDGQLGSGEVRKILIDVVEALAHAHDAGIVHRDIKPDNVFLVGKNALVTDFGVSKALQPSPVQRPVTGVGITLGTPGYMAPEQAAGDPELNHRADLYSVGVLGYELLTARRPFVGTSIQKLLVAQAVETPVPLLQVAPAVSPALAAIVMRCLEKRPEDRYADAHELLAALESLPTGSTPATGGEAGVPLARSSRRRRWIPVAIGAAVLLLGLLGLYARRARAGGRLLGEHEASIALLPPEYFQPDSRVGSAIADLMDHINTDLRQIDGLRLKIVSYLSGADLRQGGMKSLPEIGRTLGVEHLVALDPRGTEDAPVLEVRFIEVLTEKVVWTASYTLEAARFEEIDKDVIARINRAFPALAGGAPALIHPERAGSEAAHRAFLVGQRALRRRTPDGIAESIRAFEEAVRLDPANVDAKGSLATALALQLSYGYRTGAASYPTAARALTLADQAVKLAPTRGDPIAYRAFIEYLAFAPVGLVDDDFDRATRKGVTEAAGWHSLLLLREGKTEAALQEAREAIELDPLSSARHLTYAVVALGARQYALAQKEAQRAGEVEPQLRRPRQIEAIAQLLTGQVAACAAMDLAPYWGVKAMCLEGAGQQPAARAIVDSLRRVVDAGNSASPYSEGLPAQELAIYYAWHGDATATLRYLGIAYERSPIGVDQRIVQSGVFDRVRQAPGFSTELQRLQDTVWPKVLEQRQRLQDSGETSPVAARVVPRRPVV